MTMPLLDELDALVLDVDATGDEAKAAKILEIHREIERGEHEEAEG